MLSNLSLQLINNFFHVNITSFAVYLQFNVPIQCAYTQWPLLGTTFLTT